MAKEDNKVDTSIIDNEMKKDATTMESSSSSYGFFDNKYVRAGLATALAVYASKKEPIMLNAFAEKMSEFEKYDRDTRAKFIEAATASATTEIARNRLRRLERREKIAPLIKKAVENGMNPIIAGKAYKSGQLPTLMKLKLANSSQDLNALYTVGKEYEGTGNFSANDVIEALAGPTLKLENTFNNLKAPRTISPIQNFIGGGDDKSDQQEIQDRVDSQNLSSDDYKSVDFSGVGVSDLGEKALASMQKTRNITANQIKSGFTRTLSNVLGIDSDFLNGQYVFQSDDKINEGYGMQIQSRMSNDVEDLITKDFMSPNDAQTQVFNKYFKNVKGKGLTINQEVVGPNGLDILPAGWTPAKSGGSGSGGSGSGGSGSGGSGSGGSGTRTLADIKTAWIATKAKLLKNNYNNPRNIRYKKQIRIQGKSAANQYKVLGGDISDLDLNP